MRRWEAPITCCVRLAFLRGALRRSSSVAGSQSAPSSARRLRSHRCHRANAVIDLALPYPGAGSTARGGRRLGWVLPHQEAASRMTRTGRRRDGRLLTKRAGLQKGKPANRASREEGLSLAVDRDFGRAFGSLGEDVAHGLHLVAVLGRPGEAVAAECGRGRGALNHEVVHVVARCDAVDGD